MGFIIFLFIRHIIAAKLYVYVLSLASQMCHNLLHKTGIIIVIKAIKEMALLSPIVKGFSKHIVRVEHCMSSMTTYESHTQ